MLRRNYARELTAWAFLPLMLAGIQAGTMGVVLKKGFEGVEGLGENTIDYAVGAIAASAAIGNLSSGLWSSLATGRRKVPFLTGLMIATTCCVVLMTFIPWTAFGAWMLVSLVVLGWIFWSGVVTIRTTVWRANYPDADRATVAGRIATVQVLVMALAGLLIGYALDRSMESIRLVFPLLAVFGVVGAMVYSRVRLRGQSRLARAERTGSASERASMNPLMILRVLGEDRRYAGYMTCMMVFGFGNLMIGPTVTIILEDEFQTDYLVAILITTVIPLAIMPFAIPIWARLLGRMHVISFRAIHSWLFVLTGLLFLGGTIFGIFSLIVLGSICMGIAFGGGVLAWNLGHQHFARPEQDSLYMSVHVTLTGVRGIIGPYLGVFVYEWLRPGGHGGWVFGCSAVLTTLGAIGFVLLRRANAPEASDDRKDD